MRQFTYKERCLFLGLVIVIVAAGLFVFALKPAIDRIQTLNRVIPEKNRTLQQLRAMSEEYLTLQAELDNLKKKANLEKGGLELLTFLESTTRKEGMTEKVTTMKQVISPMDSSYDEIIVEVGLEKLTFEQLVNFLVKIKSSNHFLWIKSLYTKKNMANPDLLDTLIQISTLRSNAAI